jgi:hypothetical protein
MHHWVLLAARLFTTLKYVSDERLAHCAWVADIDLMLAGCRTCWTYQLLDTMSSLGVLSRTAWDHRVNSVIDRHAVHYAFTARAKGHQTCAAWQTMPSRWVAMVGDPRVAPSKEIDGCALMLHGC